MSEPKRLRKTTGPASVLMGGANALRAPRGARQRALAFSDRAASLVSGQHGSRLEPVRQAPSGPLSRERMGNKSSRLLKNGDG